MHPAPDVSIVIVNFNTFAYTAQCLDSIAAHPPKASYEIFLVDNASSDDSADRLEANYPQVRIIRSTTNRGIAGGNNLGIRASSGQYILLLNNDTLVWPGTIDMTVDFLISHPRAGGVGGNLLNDDGSFQSGYSGFHTLWSVFLTTTKLGLLLRPYYPSHPPGKSIRQVDWMSTAFMTFRRDALEEIGLVDEEYFIYSDETDLQYRLQKQGWEIYYLPDLNTTHFGGKSLNQWRRRRLVYRGILLFFTRHRSSIETALLRMMFITACILKLPFWWVSSLFSNTRQRAKQEIGSNISILRMCLKQGIEAP
jgi:N-acetylglucosaminyl-diphospho-decaprenol L-rhamnosyltransferase